MASPLADILGMQPQQVQPARPNIGPTDVLGAYQLSTNAANQQYLAKLQQQNALWGGLAGIGGAGLQAAILKNGLPSLSSLFGGATPAAATAAPATMAAVDPAASMGAGLAADGTMAAAPAVADAGAAAGGTVAADLAPTLAADAAGTVGADAGAMSLADILPFLAFA